MTSSLALALAHRAGSTPLPVWVGARLAAGLIGVVIVWALFQMRPLQALQEPPTIKAEITVRLADKPPEPIVTNIPQPNAAPPTTPQTQRTKQEAATFPSPTEPRPQLPRQTNVPSVNSRDTAPLAVAPSLAPRIASAPLGALQANENSGGASAPMPRLGNRTLTILRARECARLDLRDRPPDCPPNDELMRMLAAERAPKYRPENAEGFSRNEQAWRGIPPPCLDNGEERSLKGGKLCIRVGNTPSRVRTPKEICEARGLGGCAPTPNQAAVNAAVEQARRQDAAKGKE